MSGEKNTANNDFLSQRASKLLRVTCYGSSSSKTPEKYMKEARALGYTLAKRGHTCVNGAGSFGCMAAMNDGAAEGNGHIIGVIHEMFVVDGSDWCQRDGGAHQVFRKENENGEGPTRECLVAGGNDLQERKRLLVEGADALVVLPGGPGTWDELWEMACARNIGLTDLPIVCVNADGYYENFRQMLNQANEDQLIYREPQEIIHFESTAEGAVRWIEQQCATEAPSKKKPSLKRRDSAITVTGWSWLPRSISRQLSRVLSNPLSWDNGKLVESSDGRLGQVCSLAFTFATGIAIGIVLAGKTGHTRSIKG